MGKNVIKLTESDLIRIVKRVINEDMEDTELRFGVAYNKQTELVDDVINRIKEYGDEYISVLNQLNLDFPTKKYKKLDRPRRSTFELPKGVKVQSSVFGDD